jgi:long-chain fatty acid transport protein
MGCAITIGPNRIKSDENYFVIPHLAWSKQLNNGNAFALSFYGRGGMNTTWKGGSATFDPDGPGTDFGPMTFPGTYGAGDAGVDYNQAFLDITWAKKINERFSFGISGVIVAHWFEAEGVASFAPLTETYARPLLETGQPGNPTNLSNNGHDWAFGYGFKVGIHYALSERVSFGAMYQSTIWMDRPPIPWPGISTLSMLGTAMWIQWATRSHIFSVARPPVSVVPISTVALVVATAVASAGKT